MIVLEEEKSKMHRVYTTVMEMLNDRGYLVSDLTMTKEHFIESYDDNFSSHFCVTKRADDTDQILVLFTAVLSTQTVRETKSQMEREGVHTVIFVVRRHMTSIARTMCESSAKVHFEIFMETELLFNVTKHKMVPKHQLLTEDEKKSLLLKYTLTESEIPRIQVTDPIAKYYGLRRGQVLKIARRSESAGKYITYRFGV
ncbi:hypothetical protein RND81_06G229000 [Saponaria officinalis]|uniref:DNA-directed RNA polymerases I, II, and III subunit RPABC1 n=1 Tax=Saponaria officinalis TaxID=3572 RepID=A0AAW1KDB8_SAPOF